MNTDDDITEVPNTHIPMNREQLKQLTNIKIENILERYIIYLKDGFNKEDNEEFDYDYVQNYLSFYDFPYMEKQECYIYYQKLVDDNFDNRYIDECYDANISIIVERYRGETDGEYFEDDDAILNENDSEDEGETNYDNLDSNNRYKFWVNMEQYFDIILNEDYELNKVDFVKSIIDSLNNLVFLK